MISKLFGFLSELFSRSRTHQQWERVLGKQLEISTSYALANFSIMFQNVTSNIEAKIQKLISPQKGKKSAILNSEQSDEVLTVTVEAPGSIEIESLTLENVVESQRDLLIGGQPYSIIREPVDISTLTCALKPLAGCPIYPAIDFRQGSEKIRPIMHWYTYRTPEVERVDGKSKENTLRESITMLDGPSRRFGVTNCEYRWTGDSYVPSSVDAGKKLFLVADLGPHAIVNLRIVSYNILADLYLDLSGPQESLFFPYCPKAYQMYEYRHPLVMKELLSYDMDLCFLQEVDHRMQMRFVFSECYGLASLLEGSGNDVLVLRDRISGDFIVCGNTHLHHNPKHEHLKALQAAVAVRKLESIRKRYSEANPDCAVRLVLAGDFNSTPDGPVYELLSTGVLPKSSPWWNLDENIVPEDLMLLPSGEKLRNLTGTEITNYTRYFDENGVQRGFCGCLDYIWTDSAELHRIAPRPSHELLTKYGAIPSKVAPSDHIPLLCEVRFNKIQKNT
ncbi:endonuclease/exonuclease/phosphatase family protein [Ancylostoma ceylanicum]|uniref:Endonuclease/exonuclease/phosphatase family protein n=1 Tax=Ancylostoma ceylanicum TaxID=53326 RepID=A0A0D6M9S3_9BILA|nr:endonuclease/exonuclease/phosphatase family protein [Ancylostoma ceylanicum]